MFNYDMTMWMMMGLSPKNNKKMEEYKNNKIFITELSYLMNLALDLFEWEGLPETISPTFIEKSLLFRGNVGMQVSEEFGLIALPFSRTQGVNIYGEPETVELNSMNGKTFKGVPYMIGYDNTFADTAIMYDNPARFVVGMEIIDGAMRIGDLMAAQVVAAKKLKNPYVFIGDKNEENKIKLLMENINNNSEAYLLGDSMRIESLFSAVDISINSDSVRAIWEALRNNENRLRERLGFNANENIDKKERLLTDEINSNDEVIDTALDFRLRQRKEFCDVCNEMFGLNMSVKLRRETIAEYKEIFDEDYGVEEEVETDEDL